MNAVKILEKNLETRKPLADLLLESGVKEDSVKAKATELREQYSSEDTKASAIETVEEVIAKVISKREKASKVKEKKRK